MRRFKVLAGAVAAALAGCGGGSSDNSMTKAVPFTSWSAVQPSTQVKAQGISQQATLTYNIAGDVIIADLPDPVDTNDSNILYTFDANRNLVGVQVTADSTLLGWSNQALGGGSVACSAGLCTAFNASGNAYFVGADPYVQGWNYQNFGAWSFQGAGSSRIGAMSVGSQTPVAAVPTSGTATYNGIAGGYYVDATGKVFRVSANMRSDVDFGAAHVSFRTTGTGLTPIAGGSAVGNAGLDIPATTLNYSTATNRFTGNVATSNGNLSGPVTGRFYGPAAEEIGGVYALSGNAPALGAVRESMVGSFGGKK